MKKKFEIVDTEIQCLNCGYIFGVRVRAYVPFNTPKVFQCNQCNRAVKTIRNFNNKYENELC
ncbi:MAG: hypothetical protein NTW25_00320 [Candidatus Kapabacteria bacterium]|nr:hypothetical protein [Candidatus Kapabacteria bacterium]